jgi:V8-like Glu-specific endopeptidase
MGKVVDASKFPYNCVGLLEIQLDGGSGGSGTGALIGSTHVLTCAHNLYYGGKFAQKAKFFAHYNSTVQPTGGIAVDTGFIPKQYVKSPQFQGWDIAVYRLSSPVYLSTYLEPMITTKSQDPPNPLRIAGYPGNHAYEMWEDEQPWNGISVDDNLMAYGHNTEAGSSGSPVYKVESSRGRVYSVHGGLIGPSEDKRGCLVTEATADFIRKAVEYGSSDYFIVQI